MGLVDKLIKLRKWRLAREILLIIGMEVHPQTNIGADLRVHHRGIGTVIHPSTVIGDGVTIFHQVTIGRADAYLPMNESKMERVVIGRGAVLCAGAKVLGGAGVTKVGEGTILAANAVLTTSTGDWEIWGGVPARKLGDRTRGGAS